MLRRSFSPLQKKLKLKENTVILPKNEWLLRACLEVARGGGVSNVSARHKKSGLVNNSRPDNSEGVLKTNKQNVDS